MTQDALLIALRIKGFAKPDILSACLDLDENEIDHMLAALEARGLVAQTKIGPKLTPDGQQAADAASKAEQSQCCPENIKAAYDAFNEINTPFKTLIADWQTRTINGEQMANDHSDADYDAGIIRRLNDMHTQAVAIAQRFASLIPRFAQYERRLTVALARINAGEHRYVAAPIIDSYHTVWFEWHEDIIRASGKTRAAEALAGRAV